TVLIDLLGSLLADHLENATAPPDACRPTLLAQIHAFIQEHLADRSLCSNKIAVAHGISTRTLHRLFEPHDVTVAELIRTQRLNSCRRDLSDPSRADQPIHAVAARWGFTDAANFSRAFRAAYGLSPREYRHVISATCDSGSVPVTTDASLRRPAGRAW